MIAEVILWQIVKIVKMHALFIIVVIIVFLSGSSRHMLTGPIRNPLLPTDPPPTAPPPERDIIKHL